MTGARSESTRGAPATSTPVDKCALAATDRACKHQPALELWRRRDGPPASSAPRGSRGHRGTTARRPANGAHARVTRLPFGALKRYHVTTFGCQMNAHDSERIKG